MSFIQAASDSFEHPPDVHENSGLWRHLLDEVPVLDQAFWTNRHELEIEETAFVLAQAFFGSQIPEKALRGIVGRAFDFDAPLVGLAPGDLALELFHGPTGTYHDFGARFAAELLGWRYGEGTEDFRVVASLPNDQTAAAVSALSYQACQGIFVVPASEEPLELPVSSAEHSPNRWTVLRCEGNLQNCESVVKTLLGAVALGNGNRPLATIREDSLPWVLGFAIALLHACNQLPPGVPPNFVISASAKAFHAPLRLLERLGLPFGETIIVSTDSDAAMPEFPCILTENEVAAAIREMKALYGYECESTGAAAWSTAQSWRATRAGNATITVIPFAPENRRCRSPRTATEVNLETGEADFLGWFREWTRLPFHHPSGHEAFEANSSDFGSNDRR